MAKKTTGTHPLLQWLKSFQADQASVNGGPSLPQDHSYLHRLWRIWFVTQPTAESGFILPTVTVLLLMVSLVIGLIISRTYSRTTQVIGDRQQIALYNAGTPAVDRAKAKLEYLFKESPLSALPNDTEISDELAISAYDIPAVGDASPESRIDINGDGILDNAWIYTVDADGDGDTETVAYSILTNSEATVGGTTYALESTVNSDKAQALVVRNGPINLSGAAGSTCTNAQTTPYESWEPVTSSKLRKAIQVHTVVFNDDPANPVFATLEMQQDREANLGNKWGAWFRYDLHLNPEERFNWNGAMHTEGSFMLQGSNVTNSSTYLYLVSSPRSCIYAPDASEISMAETDDFQGQFLVGDVVSNAVDNTYQVFVDRYQPTSINLNSDRISFASSQTLGATANHDSVLDGKTLPAQLSLNPITLLTEGIAAALTGNTDNMDARDSAAFWSDDRPAIGGNDRIINADTPAPTVEDTYRADDRYGPNPIYSEDISVPSGSFGATIPAGTSDLLENDPLASSDEEGYGLDGYWERRARRSGVRIIVGQRLELGNSTEWFHEDLDDDGVLDTALAEGGTQDYNNDGDRLDTVSEDKNSNGFLDVDPLYPPRTNAYTGTNMADRAHEMRQMKTLRDNLAAAQATAVYHYKNSYDYPTACFATTAHPGTSVTDTNSRTFSYVDTTGDTTGDFLLTDFYSGKGTNGIEFAPPFAGNATTFETQINNSSSALRIALTNLAYFAGDGDANSDSNLEVSGAFPPTQDTNTGVVHPYPNSTMWGNFSELRRVIGILDAGSTYSSLSPADKATLHTATCTIGMLAYSTNVKKSQFNQTASTVSNANLNSFMVDVQKLLDGAGGPNYNSAQKKWTGSSEMWELVSANDTYNSTTGIVTCEADPTKVVQQDLADNGVLNTPGNSSFINFPKGQLPRYTGANKYDPNLWTSSEFTSYFSQFTLAHWVCAEYRSVSGNNINQTTINTNFNNIRSLITNIQQSIFQIERDRALGFREGSFDFKSTASTSGTIPWDPITGEVTYNGFGSASTTVQLPVGCNPTVVKNLIGGSGLGLNDQSISMALAICSTTVSTTFPIRYPSVYYLFPVAAHSHDGSFPPSNIALNGGTGTNSVQTNAGTANIPQAIQSSSILAVRDNGYTKDPYIYNAAGSGINYYRDGTSKRFFYRPVEDALSVSPDGVVQSATESLASFVTYLGVTPRTSASTWKTPVVADTDLTIDSTRANAIRFQSNTTVPGAGQAGTANVYYYPAFLDVGMYNGREQMGVRTLSIDLDLLRRTKLNNASGGCTYTDPASDTTDSNGLCWLPLPTLIEAAGGTTSSGAIIYAFREDAIREDAIARPTRTDASGLSCATWQTTWSNYLTATSFSTSTDGSLTKDDFLMDAVGATGYFDPPVSPCTGVSPKALDFYADPDRRPHGFMLRNGSDLRRTNGTTYDTDSRGLSFISDNPVHIRGNFNLHYDRTSTDGTTTTLHEEFSTTLNTTDWDNNFYSRADLNPEFADPENDSWRVVEIISDAITVLSNSFSPGFIADGLTGTTGTSYGAMRLLGSSPSITSWVLEDGTVNTATTAATIPTPIKIDRIGLPIYSASGTRTVYGFASGQVLEALTSTAGRGRINDATDTTVNAVLMSGIAPYRPNQTYGGLQNFLRLIEDWSPTTVTLNFAGSLIQPSFSTYTAGFDQDAWEPGAFTTGEVTGYFNTHSAYRNWVYDPALQYAPAGPVARRFEASGNTRSEFYRELATDDPYILNLRCAYYDSSGDGTIQTDGTDDRVDPNVDTSLCSN